MAENLAIEANPFGTHPLAGEIGALPIDSPLGPDGRSLTHFTRLKRALHNVLPHRVIGGRLRSRTLLNAG